MDIRRLRPSPAMVVATIALVISLGGVGYAVRRRRRPFVIDGRAGGGGWSTGRTCR